MSDRNEPSKVIDYLSPADDWQRRSSERSWATGAALFIVVTVMGTVAALLAINPKLGPIFPVAVVLGAVVPWAAIGWYRWKVKRSRGFAQGVLIGFCIAALIEGVCFGIFASR